MQLRRREVFALVAARNGPSSGIEAQDRIWGMSIAARHACPRYARAMISKKGQQRRLSQLSDAIAQLAEHGIPGLHQPIIVGDEWLSLARPWTMVFDRHRVNESPLRRDPSNLQYFRRERCIRNVATVAG